MTRGRELDCAVRRNFVLDLRHADRIDALAATTRFNKSEIVRDAIDSYTDQHVQRAQEVEQLREENQRLKGRVEELEAELEPANKRKNVWDQTQGVYLE